MFTFQKRGWIFTFTLLLVLFTHSFSQKEKYLLIVADQYADDSNLADFIEFREQDYDVTVKTLSEVGNSESGITSEMQDMYGNGGLKYTLMIGGPAGGIPYKSGSYNTFHDYGLMDYDTQLDVGVGCWFVSNSTDLANIIHKTIYTEQNIAAYPKVTTQFTSYTSRPHIEEQCEAIKNQYWSQTNYTVSWMIPDYNTGTSLEYVEALRNQINSNETSIISYQAHGAETGWVNGGSYYYANEEQRQGLAFDVNDVKSLTNDEVYPIIMSFACVTGSFQQSGSFGEKWLTAEGGACAFIGSSKNSSHYQKTLNASLVSAFCQEEIGTLGELFMAGKNYLRDSTDHFEDVMTTSSSGGVSVIIDDEQMYNLFGDPALRIKPKPVAKSAKLLGKTSDFVKIKSITSKGLTLSISNEGNYSVSLLNVKGETISNLSMNKFFSIGDHSLSLDKNIPANGIYFLNIKNAKTNLISKVSIVK